MTAPQERSWGCFYERPTYMKLASELYNSTTRKFFGFAASLDAHDLYTAMDRPIGRALPQKTKLHVANLAAEHPGILSENTYINSRTTELLALATYSMYTILKNEFDRNQDLTVESKYDIANHPVTAETIALLALRSDGSLRSLMMNQRGASQDSDTYRINPDGLYLEAKDTLPAPTKGGCPFAGHNETVKPDPLFTRAVSILGTLAVDCYETHDIKKDA